MTFVAKRIASVDIYNENFNHFFTEKLNAMTDEQRIVLPQELSFKIFKYGNIASAGLLNFNEKMWMLSNVFNCQLTIVVEDADNGMDIKDYVASQKVQRGTKNNGDLLEAMKTHAAFALGNKELMNSLMYMAHVCCSNVYQLVKKYTPNADHPKNTKFIDGKMAFTKTLQFLKNYEANKRRITETYGITMPEWYALMYFAIGEGFAKDFYKKDFVYSYNSSMINLHKGMLRMYSMGYLIKRKVGIKDKYSISSKGMDLLDKIFNNLLLKI